MLWSRRLRCRSYNSRIWVEGLEASDCGVFSVRFFWGCCLLFCCDDLYMCRDTSRQRFIHSHTDVSLKSTRGAMLDVRASTVFDGFKFHRVRFLHLIQFLDNVWFLWICVSTRLELNHLCFASVLLQSKDVRRRAFSDKVSAFCGQSRIGSSQRWMRFVTEPPSTPSRHPR